MMRVTVVVIAVSGALVSVTHASSANTVLGPRVPTSRTSAEAMLLLLAALNEWWPLEAVIRLRVSLVGTLQEDDHGHGHAPRH
jgi:hypothetical protein